MLQADHAVPWQSPACHPTRDTEKRLEGRAVARPDSRRFLAPAFVAQLDHDELMARSLLRLSRAKVIAAYRTEGELKRLFPLARNRYSPDQKEKYPDAIIETVSGLSVALELELTLKTRRRYRQALRTYRARSDVSRIVFIVRSAAAFDSITQAMKDTYYPVLERPIGFTWADDWTRDPLSARIDFKSTATSIGEMAGLESA